MIRAASVSAESPLITSCCNYVRKTEKKSIPGQGPVCVGSARSSMSNLGIPSHPKNVHMRSTGVPKLSQSECWYECVLRWNGVLFRAGSRLAA